MICYISYVTYELQFLDLGHKELDKKYPSLTTHFPTPYKVWFIELSRHKIRSTTFPLTIQAFVK